LFIYFPMERSQLLLLSTAILHYLEGIACWRLVWGHPPYMASSKDCCSLQPPHVLCRGTYFSSGSDIWLHRRDKATRREQGLLVTTALLKLFFSCYFFLFCFLKLKHRLLWHLHGPGEQCGNLGFPQVKAASCQQPLPLNGGVARAGSSPLSTRVAVQQQGGIQPDRSHRSPTSHILVSLWNWVFLPLDPPQAFPIQRPHVTLSSPSPQRTECSAALDSKAWCDSGSAENTRASQSGLWKPRVSLHGFISLSGESYLWVDSFVGGKINKTNPKTTFWSEKVALPPENTTSCCLQKHTAWPKPVSTKHRNFSSCTDIPHSLPHSSHRWAVSFLLWVQTSFQLSSSRTCYLTSHSSASSLNLPFFFF